MTKPAVSMLARYRREVFPLLVDHGFKGTVATAEKTLARGEYWARASGNGGVLHVQIQGAWAGQAGISVPLEQTLDVPPAERDRAIEKLRARVRRVLRVIDDRDRAAPVRAVTSLTDALKALLDQKAKVLRATVTRIERRGRTFAVHVRGRRKPVIAERTMLLTLVRDLAGERLFVAGRDPRYLLRDVELVAYIEELAEVDKEEARALYVHLHSAYQTHSEPPARLAKLFPRPVWAAKHLNAAATGTSLIRRALPHAAKGSLVDRVAALSAIDIALGSAYDGDPRFAEMLAALRDLTGSMSRGKIPILREIAWLLDRELSRSARPAHAHRI